MKLKSGKEEIVYLLSKVFKKYEQTTGREVIRNTNRKNYEEIARELSTISNNLPDTAAEKQHDEYPHEGNPPKLGYPYLKYDITGGQIKDAYNGMVSSPRNFPVDSCYIYLFGVGRKGFKENPSDVDLLEENHLHSAPSKAPKRLYQTGTGRRYTRNYQYYRKQQPREPTPRLHFSYVQMMTVLQRLETVLHITKL